MMASYAVAYQFIKGPTGSRFLLPADVSLLFMSSSLKYIWRVVCPLDLKKLAVISID